MTLDSLLKKIGTGITALAISSCGVESMQPLNKINGSTPMQTPSECVPGEIRCIEKVDREYPNLKGLVQFCCDEIAPGVPPVCDSIHGVWKNQQAVPSCNPKPKEECPEIKFSDHKYNLGSFAEDSFLFPVPEEPVRLVVGETDDPAANIAATDITLALRAGKDVALLVGECYTAKKKHHSVEVCLEEISIDPNDDFPVASLSVNRVLGYKLKPEGEFTLNDVIVHVDSVNTELGSERVKFNIQSVVPFVYRLASEVENLYETPTIIIGSPEENSALRRYFEVNESAAGCIRLEQNVAYVAAKKEEYPVLVGVSRNPDSLRAVGSVLNLYDSFKDKLNGAFTLKVKGTQSEGITVEKVE